MENIRKIEIYDTTLRDGAQGEGISFSVNDKLNYIQRIAELGNIYVEAGWPGANPRDNAFFHEIHYTEFPNLQVVAFGSTCRVGESPEQSIILKELLASNAKTLTIFGKSWDLHVCDVLHTSLEENLRIIRESVSYLVQMGRQVFFDAEHFFDGFKENPSYAILTVQAALEAGASLVVLCDTNGGSLPSEISRAVQNVMDQFTLKRLGIHVHNDNGLAVANSLAAVQAGATQIQGTWNGLGERCGNANLNSLIPLLQLKLGYQILDSDSLRKITGFSRYVAELANIPFDEKQPFVGRSAFAHKAGMHVDGILKNRHTFEHIDPSLVGNERRILISDQAGRANIWDKLRQFQPDIEKDDPIVVETMTKIKELENLGFQFETAEGSLELLLLKLLGRFEPPFQVLDYHVWSDPLRGELDSVAAIKVQVGPETIHIAAEGNGPVHALDSALRQALKSFFPVLNEAELVDYKVRVLDGSYGTGAMVRVVVQTRLGSFNWGTIGVSTNILKASAQALLDALYMAIRLGKTR